MRRQHKELEEGTPCEQNCRRSGRGALLSIYCTRRLLRLQEMLEKNRPVAVLFRRGSILKLTSVFDVRPPLLCSLDWHPFLIPIQRQLSRHATFRGVSAGCDSSFSLRFADSKYMLELMSNNRQAHLSQWPQRHRYRSIPYCEFES